MCAAYGACGDCTEGPIRRSGGGRILRVSDAGASPGDDLCTLWHILDLLPEEAGGWSPKFKYG